MCGQAKADVTYLLPLNHTITEKGIPKPPPIGANSTVLLGASERCRSMQRRSRHKWMDTISRWCSHYI